MRGQGEVIRARKIEKRSGHRVRGVTEQDDGRARRKNGKRHRKDAAIIQGDLCREPVAGVRGRNGRVQRQAEPE